MLSKTNRLRKNKEFSYVYKKGKMLNDKYFSVHYVYTNLPYPKIGISVSKKVGNSVVRHRVKRLLNEAIRPIISDIVIKNYVITARDSIVDADYRTLCSHLKNTFIKGGLYRGSDL